MFKQFMVLALSAWLSIFSLSSAASPTSLPVWPDEEPIFLVTQHSCDSSEQSVLERVNRKVFGFNEKLDRYFLKPVAKTYDFVMPDFLIKGIDNIFDNLDEVSTVINSGLQAKPKNMCVSLMRFTANSTIGLAGFFDVASQLGIHAKKEDFGQTLAVWGVPSGAYIMLPVLGPSTVRDALARIPDNYSQPLSYVDKTAHRIGAQSLDVVNTRARLLGVESLMIGDRYEFVKDLYLGKREADINDNISSDVPESDDFVE